MAPEVLRGKQYTQASDIYSFSMIMWEFTSGISPFNDRAHDLQLNLMKKCWNKDPLKRPSAEEVSGIIENWIFRSYDDIISEELKNNIMDFINAPVGNNNPITKSHPQAYYTSRLHDFTSREVNEILESECSNYILVNDESSEKLDETVKSECVDCAVSLFDIKPDKN
ncbi:hypothetical protein RclHR1_09290005 [Rhizophagus clarus]|uniref:Protein kinase domain-containing protein n=1 Tax=Rhizophagus clarus TaxID=94130 RepID=A0A2Z6SI66_9GLOM|nr:hypothetical protein RclHR1_09290005 [Rhizophagus clarus]